MHPLFNIITQNKCIETDVSKTANLIYQLLSSFEVMLLIHKAKIYHGT